VVPEEGDAKSEELRVCSLGSPMVVEILGIGVAAERAGALGGPVWGVRAKRLDDVEADA